MLPHTHNYAVQQARCGHGSQPVAHGHLSRPIHPAVLTLVALPQAPVHRWRRQQLLRLKLQHQKLSRPRHHPVPTHSTPNRYACIPAAAAMPGFAALWAHPPSSIGCCPRRACPQGQNTTLQPRQGPPCTQHPRCTSRSSRQLAAASLGGCGWAPVSWRQTRHAW